MSDDLKAARSVASFFAPRLHYSHANCDFCVVKSGSDRENRIYLTCTGLANTWDSAVEIDIWQEYLCYVSVHKDAFAGCVNVSSVGNLESISRFFSRIAPNDANSLKTRTESRDICVGSLVINLSDGLGWLDSWIELALIQQQEMCDSSMKETKRGSKGVVKFTSDTRFENVKKQKCLDF